MDRKRFGVPAAIIALSVLLCSARPARTDSVTWTGATNNTWADGDSSNWSGGDGTYNNDDAATFDDSGNNTDPISISGTVQPDSMLFDNTTSVDYTLRDGTLGGSGTLTKQNTGTLRVLTDGGGAVSTTFSGGTDILGGSLVSFINSTADAAHDASLGTGPVAIDNGSTFRVRTAASHGGSNRAIVSNDLNVGSGGGEIALTIPNWLRDGFIAGGRTTLGGT